jgi:biopolymer transport protein ExbB
MRTIRSWILFWLLSVLLFGGPVLAQEMRVLHVQAQEAKQQLLEKVAAEKQVAEQAAEQSRALITHDRKALQKVIADLKAGNHQISQAIKKLESQYTPLEEKEKKLSEQLAEMDSMVHELVGVIRVTAKDVGALIDQNLQSALAERQDRFLKVIAEQDQFPAMEDIRAMVTVLLDDIQRSSEVSLQRGTVTDRAGAPIEAQILTLGNFTAAYRTDNEVGFLNYSPTSRKLFALSRLPTGRMQKQLVRYMEGQSDAVPMDISRGGALRQLTHELSLWEQIPKGGLIVWPILTILALGLAIVFERVIFLLRRRHDSDGFIQRINTLAVGRQWDECRKICTNHGAKPVARVVAAGLECYRMGREEMENALQEAILKEVPAMERFLSTLGMLAAIAPLLGLLGTVTGMIDTFHVITLHGTGDPRMMSGGISEALVTTMLGLSVAIPIMLAHTLLNRAVDNHIGQMEEKALALVNIVHKSRSTP